MATTENWLGFYLVDRLWVGDRPDLEIFKTNPARFTELLSELAFEDLIEDFRIRLDRDGLVSVHRKALQEKSFSRRKENESPSFSETWDIWRTRTP
jgi:hypothetical protein